MKKTTLFAFLMASALGFAQAPTTAAPNPSPRNAADVKSIFSDAYAPITTFVYSGNTDSYNTDWSPATTTKVSVAGNDTNKIVGLGTGLNETSSFEAIAFQGGRINATGFTHFHMDIWTETATLDRSFNIKFSNWKGGTGEVNAIEYSGTNATFLTNPNPGTWISVDVPFSAFSLAGGPNMDRDDLVQLVITSNLGTVYYDNIYLYKESLGTQTFRKANINMYPNPVKNSLNIEAKSTIKKVSVYNVLGQEVLAKNPNNNTTTLQTNNLAKGVYVIKANVDGKEATSKFVKE